jgi:hypothetical protein
MVSLFVVGGFEGYDGFCWVLLVWGGRGIRGGGMRRGFIMASPPLLLTITSALFEISKVENRDLKRGC